jgi:hypothetical protein
MATTTHTAGQQPLPGTTAHATVTPAQTTPAEPKPGPSKFFDGSPLAPGELPHITDTEPPAMHPATIIGDGFVHIDAAKLKKGEHVPPLLEPLVVHIDKEHAAKASNTHEHHNERSKPAHA